MLTVVVVGAVGFLAVLYAQGYRLNRNNKITSNGLLVVNSDPNGAQILIDGVLNTATNATITLAPKTYDVVIKKESYLNWEKKINVQNGVVTSVDISLFPQAAALNPLTFAGAVNPQVSPDYSRILYSDASGMWIFETINLPIGFNSSPRKITDLKIDAAAKVEWSADGRQILLSTKGGTYLLDTGTTTLVSQLVDVTAAAVKTRLDWKTTKDKQLISLLSKLPEGIRVVFQTKAKDILFSPDQNKILYTATASGILQTGLVSPLPGSSSQNEAREIKKDKFYVYDIKEDKNFEITDIDGPIYWFATSRNLLIPQKEKIVIADYDNTNKQVIYSGSYSYPNAYPTPNTNRIFILTNLGATKASANLYSLNLR